jgi:hypothetical protein
MVISPWRASLVVAITVGVGGIRPRIVLEIRMVASLLSGYTSSWVVNQHHIQQIESLLVQVGTESSVVVTKPFRERGLEVRV